MSKIQVIMESLMVLWEEGFLNSARIAVYAVCSIVGCTDKYVLAAFDDAIAGDFDIITASFEAQNPKNLKEDVVAVGSFHALDKSVINVQAAGNDGFTAGSIMSIVSWLFTVAASGTNRRINNKVVLQNGNIINCMYCQLIFLQVQQIWLVAD